MERFTKMKLEPADRPRWLVEYYVTGRGDFPADMLRYDAAWCATGQDVDTMRDVYQSTRSVRLRSYREPTIERWSSFGWSVGSFEIY